jgi:hypothetical protein
MVPWTFIFGPTAPTGRENNWVQTITGKGWNTLLRLYGPLQARGSIRLGDPAR